MLVATYNIQYGVGRDKKLDLKRAINAVANADVIALQEVDVNWDRSQNQDQVALIRDMLPDHEAAWGPTIDVRKSSGSSLRRQFGNMILSRYPIVSIRNYLLSKYGASVYMDLQKGALEALIDTPIGLLRFYSTHLCSASVEQRHRQLEWLLDHHKKASDEGPVLAGQHPTDATWTSEPALPPMPSGAILLGDFNFEDATDSYAAVVGERSKRVGHLTRRGGFVDAWTVHHGFSDASREAGWTVLSPYNCRVDYCFVSESLTGKIKSAVVDKGADGSDHQPLVVELAA
ncbi:endonuclease/exonuclease/phosphatase family protein [Bradyrhizobium sp. Pear77]|uniref:endonuclease/exonuclease/phosphatase family protein n=1 Tax=Bradyrhizobium altum TaxID=1571202 RepID=UPI00289E4714|nr:endonuclease/exonuclease/phosphatase family protein [Bradyrhizobium altum]MCC8957594.1 endonuclease/exonuclease/phosphatase family protein [Bradyrhizobium altum]